MACECTYKLLNILQSYMETAAGLGLIVGPAVGGGLYEVRTNAGQFSLVAIAEAEN